MSFFRSSAYLFHAHTINFRVNIGAKVRHFIFRAFVQTKSIPAILLICNNAHLQYCTMHTCNIAQYTFAVLHNAHLQYCTMHFCHIAQCTFAMHNCNCLVKIWHEIFRKLYICFHIASLLSIAVFVVFVRPKILVLLSSVHGKRSVHT